MPYGYEVTTKYFERSRDTDDKPHTADPKVPVAAQVDVVVHAKIVLRLPSPSIGALRFTCPFKTLNSNPNSLLEPLQNPHKPVQSRTCPSFEMDTTA